jgi:hypothetical protein
MTRSYYYQNQIATKLLSSKFVYSQVPNSGLAKKLILCSTVSTKNPEVGSATIHLLFGRRPSFRRTFRRRENEYKLINLILTSHKGETARDLDRLATSILPFQLENETAVIAPLRDEGVS